MDAIQFPDVQSEDADAVLPALQHTVSQAMQVSLTAYCQSGNAGMHYSIMSVRQCRYALQHTVSQAMQVSHELLSHGLCTQALPLL